MVLEVAYINWQDQKWLSIYSGMSEKVLLLNLLNLFEKLMQLISLIALPIPCRWSLIGTLLVLH